MCRPSTCAEACFAVYLLVKGDPLLAGELVEHLVLADAVGAKCGGSVVGGGIVGGRYHGLGLLDRRRLARLDLGDGIDRPVGDTLALGLERLDADKLLGIDDKRLAEGVVATHLDLEARTRLVAEQQQARVGIGADDALLARAVREY